MLLSILSSPQRWRSVLVGLSLRLRVYAPKTLVVIGLSPSWMTCLGLAPKKTASPVQEKQGKQPSPIQNGTSDEARRLAAAALSAVKDAAITEVREFAGQDIEVKKFVDADSKEASEKAKATIGPPSAVDAILEQIRKKQKLSVLDKTKKDWENTRKKARAWKMSRILTRRAQIIGSSGAIVVMLGEYDDMRSNIIEGRDAL
ncbi:hypothetical protein LOK49_LG05G00486 [Camellia lanceoleosa]|uniref:Uncharacterized protein n=1 Tax=Camellia lanceoleosa TaxID=1840588 RepID=A0ACC0HTY2_9ERIC|nr:hypothetical protein LOK49_LG05G00486 [Camellia lanceoleosa]